MVQMCLSNEKGVAQFIDEFLSHPRASGQVLLFQHHDGVRVGICEVNSLIVLTVDGGDDA
jgi:hypothetical protein